MQCCWVFVTLIRVHYLHWEVPLHQLGKLGCLGRHSLSSLLWNACLHANWSTGHHWNGPTDQWTATTWKIKRVNHNPLISTVNTACAGASYKSVKPFWIWNKHIVRFLCYSLVNMFNGITCIHVSSIHWFNKKFSWQSWPFSNVTCMIQPFLARNKTHG